jgi:CrcB protein
MVGTLSMRRRVVAILCGGFLGTITRYGLSLLIQSYLGKGWPSDIFLINISGALIIAFITTLADAAFLIGPTRRLFINVGFLGSYTTFSSLALGDVQLFANGHALLALLYFFLSLLGGFIAVMLGDWLAQLVLKANRRSHSTQYGAVSSNVLPKNLEEHMDIQDDLIVK